MEVLIFKSSNVEITALTASNIANCWRRFRARVKYPNTYCRYSTTLDGILKLALPPDFALQEVGHDIAREWNDLPPVFYETAIYNISIHLSNIEGVPRVLHKMKEITEMFTVIHIGGNDSHEWLISAPLSFLNEPGIFELKFKYKPIGSAERIDTFCFRVVSPKLDTKDDYNKILSEINQQYNEIIYKYLTVTLQNLQRGGKSNNDIIWLSIFQNLAKEYIDSVRYIVAKPHLRQTYQTYFDRADRIKHWTPLMEEKYTEDECDGRLDKTYFQHTEIINTHNTRENRFVKFTLEKIGKRLQTIVNFIKEKNEKAKEAEKVSKSELEVLDGYVSMLRRLANSKLFRNLRGEPLRSESLVLQKRTGYSQIYKYWLILQKGIELFEGSNAIGVRPIWELYELWCFLKIRKMVAEILKLDFDNIEEITEQPMPMLQPFEDNNQEHIVNFYRHDGTKVRLHYQHTYSRNTGEVHTATTENRPDIVLTIIKPDMELELTYLFDAKYRLLDDRKLNQEDQEELRLSGGADTPPADAINQMHRYRDAIYYGSDKYTHTAKEIIGGYIIFPGRGTNETVRERFFYKSIETVNIGAFPLLPDTDNSADNCTLLYEFLRNILLSDSAYDLIKDSKPQKGLKYVPSAVRDKNDLVLIGYYKNKQWDAIVKNRLYYIPATYGDGKINLVPGYENTKYLLLHQALHKGGKRLFVRLEEDGPQFYTKAALEKLGFEPSGDYFFGFKIQSFDPVEGLNPDKYEFPRRDDSMYTPDFIPLETIEEQLST